MYYIIKEMFDEYCEQLEVFLLNLYKEFLKNAPEIKFIEDSEEEDL